MRKSIKLSFKSSFDRPISRPSNLFNHNLRSFGSFRALSTNTRSSAISYAIKVPCLHGWAGEENLVYARLRYPAVLKSGKIIEYTKRVGNVIARVNVVPSRFVYRQEIPTVELLASHIDKPMKVVRSYHPTVNGKPKVEPGCWIMDLEPID